MFGYIRPDTPELRVRENEYYRAVYCGLCRAQGKCTGQCSRMTLSYDAVFLALVRMALDKTQITVKRGRCIAHPLKKRAYVDFCEPLAYCAYAYALLVYGKCLDDINDEKGMERFKARLKKQLAKGMRKKALKKYSELDGRISDSLARLSATEKKCLPSVDVPAEHFGELLSEILSYGLEGADEKITKSIGKHIGRWIYITDAADDLEDDLKKGRFNPFACLYDGQLLTDEQKSDVSTSLRLELLASEPAFDLIDFDGMSDIEGIIKNIIYRGMPDVADRILGLDSAACKSGKDKKTKGRKKNG